MTAIRPPNFLIVGVQKTGTTFLAQHLSQHPDVFFCDPKEPFFFNTPNVTKSDFKVYLAENFFAAKMETWVGEGSTNYFHHPRALDHITRYLGKQTRIIVCLRHPLERTLSHYLHDYRKGRRTGSEPITDDSWRGYTSRSFYADRLKLWGGTFRHFNVLFFDDLVKSGADFYARGARSLDIVPQPIADRPINEGLRLQWDGDDLVMSGAPGAGQTTPRFPRKALEDLLTTFSSDVQATMQATGRDLSAWLKMPDFDEVGQKLAAARADDTRLKPRGRAR